MTPTSSPTATLPTSPSIEWLARSRAWVSIGLLVPAGAIAVGSLPRIEPDSGWDLVLDVCGWTAFIAGALFRWWATLYIGGRKTSELVTTGAYSVCRNPLYVGTFLMLTSVVCFMQSLTFAAATLLVALYYLGVTVTVEERRLARIYGAKFADYVARTPRYLPNPACHESPATITVETAGLRAELYRMLRWMWIPVICHLINEARELQWWTPFTNWP